MTALGTAPRLFSPSSSPLPFTLPFPLSPLTLPRFFVRPSSTLYVSLLLATHLLFVRAQLSLQDHLDELDDIRGNPEDFSSHVFLLPRHRREANAVSSSSNSTATKGVRPSYLNLPPTISKVVPPNYDPLAMPKTPGGEPLQLKVHVKARDIQDIDESSMDITVEWYIRLYWLDTQLRPPPPAAGAAGEWTTVNSDIVKHIWVPDTFIDHVKSITSPTLMVKPHSIRMKKDGQCRYSTSVTTRLSCTMDFTSYPFDTQNCALTMESYQYRSSEIAYKWLDEGVEVADTIRTVHFSTHFYIVNEPSAVHQNVSFPRVRVNIRLVRKISYHLLNTFLPSGLFVCVSWLTFLIPPDAMPGRMVLTITTLLTLVSMFNSVRGESPRVSYAKAVDLWMMFCIVFVFLVLVEYTVVIRLRDRAKTFKVFPTISKRNSPDAGTSRKTESTVGLNDHSRSRPTAEVTGTPLPLPRNHWRIWEQRLEGNCPYILPLLFFIFNLCYWPICLTR